MRSQIWPPGVRAACNGANSQPSAGAWRRSAGCRSLRRGGAGSRWRGHPAALQPSDRGLCPAEPPAKLRRPRQQCPRTGTDRRPDLRNLLHAARSLFPEVRTYMIHAFKPAIPVTCLTCSREVGSALRGVVRDLFTKGHAARLPTGRRHVDASREAAFRTHPRFPETSHEITDPMCAEGLPPEILKVFRQHDRLFPAPVLADACASADTGTPQPRAQEREPAAGDVLTPGGHPCGFAR